MAHPMWVKGLAIIEARKQNDRVNTDIGGGRHVYVRFAWHKTPQGEAARELAYCHNDYSKLTSHLSHENLEAIYLLFEGKDRSFGHPLMYKGEKYYYISRGGCSISVHDKGRSITKIDIDDLISDSGKRYTEEKDSSSPNRLVSLLTAYESDISNMYNQHMEKVRKCQSLEHGGAPYMIDVPEFKKPPSDAEFSTTDITKQTGHPIVTFPVVGMESGARRMPAAFDDKYKDGEKITTLGGYDIYIDKDCSEVPTSTISGGGLTNPDGCIASVDYDPKTGHISNIQYKDDEKLTTITTKGVTGAIPPMSGGGRISGDDVCDENTPEEKSSSKNPLHNLFD